VTVEQRDVGTNAAVSLLVPVFNRSDLLVPCLDSALAQTMGDFEVVVVDGASTDDTWEVCLRYAAADPRVRVFRDAVNTGPVRGWWRCVEEARGTYATFLWSDDVLKATFLENTVPVLENNDVAFVFTAAEIGAMPGAGKIHYAQPTRLMPSEDFISGSLLANDKYPVSPACALFRLADIRQSFRMTLPTEPETDLTATGAGVDLLLFLLTAVQYPRVANLSEALAFFRSHSDSITVQGRGGQVALGYALTKSWFARMNGRRHRARIILAQQWLNEMRAGGRLVNPLVAATRYRHIVGAGELSATLALILLKKAMRAVTARIQRRLAAG
jgi:glycosyltransferase involved in cell wall biosynthesis